MPEHLEPSDKLKTYRGWEDRQVVLTCGWLKLADELPRLIPLTVYTQAKRIKKIYWCRDQFTDYQIFTSRVKLIAK
jgi:hypothetical protein